MPAADAARIEGELLGFSFRAEDGGFSVARVRTSEGLQITAVGPIGHVTEGQHLVLQGKWVDHPQFGRQLRVQSLLVEDPRTTRGLERYLGSGAVVGLGKEFARRVVQTFGLDTLAVIEEEPERLATPGEVLGPAVSAEGAGIRVRTGGEDLLLLEVQPPGGKRMPVNVFLQGRPLPPYARLGAAE